MSEELERLYELLYLLPVGVVAFDATGTVAAVNPLTVQLLNPFVAPVAVHNAFQLLAPLVDNLAELIAGDEAHPVVLSRRRTTLTPDGLAPITVEFSVHRTRPGQFVAIVTDVTEIVYQERELRRERDRIRIIVEMVREYAIYTIDRHGHVDSWNGSGQRLFGLIAVEAIGRSLADLVAIDPDGLAGILDDAAVAGWRRLEGWSTGTKGSEFYSDTMISTLADEAGRPDGFVVITQDASRVRQREEQLRHDAETDPLTKLANRRGFDESAIRVINACAVSGTPASVLMVDIDHFKVVNDTYGHDIGDQVLRAVSAALANRLRAMDLIARFGGEEFAALLPGASLDAAARTAETLRSTVEGLVIEVAAGTIVHASVSIGVAQLTGDLPDALRRADTALYAAKQQGRNRVVTA